MPSTIGIVSAAGSLKNFAEPKLLGYRVNYVSNPSFQVDSSDWSGNSGATVSRDTGTFRSGSASLKVINTSASAAEYSPSGRIPLLGSTDSYAISAYVKLDAAAGTANYYIRHLQYETDSSVSTVASGNIGTQSLSYTGNWVRLSGTFTRAATAGYCIFRIATNSTTNGEIFYIDDVMLENAGSVGTYFDGDNNGFWSGTASASFSGGTPY
jgi:hypothetical protein